MMAIRQKFDVKEYPCLTKFYDCPEIKVSIKAYRLNISFNSSIDRILSMFRTSHFQNDFDKKNLFNF